MTTREDCERMDRDDPLAALREQFVLPDGVIYLDGNSLGPLPRTAAARVQHVVGEEWGVGQIGSWNSAGWIDLPQRVGDKIARLVGAGAGELLVADSTSVNLYKVLSAALDLVRAEAPDRNVILSERGNFPTDLYIAQSIAQERGLELAAGRGRRARGAPHRPRSGTAADARQLSRRPHACDGDAQPRRPCRRRAGGLGPGALRRRGARRLERRR